MPKPVKNSDVQVGSPGDAPVNNGDTGVVNTLGAPVANLPTLPVPVGMPRTIDAQPTFTPDVQPPSLSSTETTLGASGGAPVGGADSFLAQSGSPVSAGSDPVIGGGGRVVTSGDVIFTAQGTPPLSVGS